MSTDYIQHKHARSLIAHGLLTFSSHGEKGFELTRDEDFINGSSDMFDLLAERNAQRSNVWTIKKV